MSKVTVEQPSGVSLSQTMGAISVWLDTQGIEPLSFQPVALAKGIGFELRFRDEKDAHLFGEEFA
ncbi:MAG TPA: hypothetical protein VET89_03190 [Stellaceae bacterium]|jgi:hypothetical protein|nr:hypothetical protein [Stellaceae bacterium]